MADIHPNLSDFKYISAGLFTLASSVTLFRLGVRVVKRKWWWDDTFALISMVCMAVFVAGAALVDEGAKQPRNIQIFAYYLVVLGYYIPIWSARMSILFTIIRIAPWPRQRKILMGCACFFVFQWIFLMVQVFWVCEITLPGWKDQEGQLCFLGKAVPICQVITTLLSDLILVCSPIWILHKVRVNPVLRFRLVSAFFASIATTIAALVHSVLVIQMPGAWEAVFGAVEVATALTVCNVSVIIPFLARKMSVSESFQENDKTRLSTLHLADMMAEMVTITTDNNAVRVDVTVDGEQTQSGAWDQKKRGSTDDESFEVSPSKARPSVDLA